MRITFQTLTSSIEVNSVTVRFLIVEDSFSYLRIVPIEQNYGLTPRIYPQTTIDDFYTIPFSFENQDLLFPFVSSYDFQPYDPNTNKMLSFVVSCSVNSANVLKLSLRQDSSTSNLNIFEYYLSVYILVYHV